MSKSVDVKDVLKPGVCAKHLQTTPCEFCAPTRCLTHKQDLPCRVCEEGKNHPFAVATLPADWGLEAEAREKALYLRIAALEAAVSTLQTQIAALSGEITVLRSL